MTNKKNIVSSNGNPIVSKCMEFRIKPTEEQAALIHKTFGCCRYVYNRLLGERIKWEKAYPGSKINNTTPAHLKESAPFLKEVDALALANTQLNVNQACAKLFPKGKMPRYRQAKEEKKSYTTNRVKTNIEIVHAGNGKDYLRLPKLGYVEIILHRDVPAGWDLKNVTVKQVPSGKYFVSINFDVEVEPVEVKKDFFFIEALDYSMPNLFFSASGDYVITPEEIHWFRDIEDKIAKEQRKLSRMEYGSANYNAQRQRIAKLYEKAKNRRKDFLHKLSRRMADQFDAVVVEDLNLQTMSQRMTFGKAVYDNGFGAFREMLAYKLNDQGKVLVKVDKMFPSSKKCCGCGTINKDLELGEEYWQCPVCGLVHYRDANAAFNLQLEGERMLNRWAGGDSSLTLSPSGVLSEKPSRTKK